jgi:hypothetical protein
MAGMPEISGPQEREREMWKTTPRRNIFTTRASTVPSGEPISPDESELRPSARVFRGNERETTAQRARRTHQGREDLEGRLAGGGWQLEVSWGGGTSL